MKIYVLSSVLIHARLLKYLSLVIFIYLVLNNQHISRFLQLCNSFCMFWLKLFSNFLKIYNAHTTVMNNNSIVFIVLCVCIIVCFYILILSNRHFTFKLTGSAIWASLPLQIKTDRLIDWLIYLLYSTQARESLKTVIQTLQLLLAGVFSQNRL